MNSFREAGESIHVHRSDENLKMMPLPSKARPQTAKRCLLYDRFRKTLRSRASRYSENTMQFGFEALYMDCVELRGTWSHAPLPSVAMETARSEDENQND